MNQTSENELYELIPHTTVTAPYSIHYTKKSAGQESALYLHWHNEMEFLLLVEGDIIFHIEDRTYSLHAGDGIFIPPGLLHSADCSRTTPVSFHAFVLSPDFIISPLNSYGYNRYIFPILHNSLSFAVPLYNHIDWQKSILDNLSHIFQAQNTRELYFRGLSFLIWEQLYDHHILPLYEAKPFHSLACQLSNVFPYIHDNYRTNLSLDELASCVHLSKGQFCRSFKQVMGMTPFQYLIRHRILQSCTELTQTNKKIIDIATSNGFNNISYYNRAFIQVMNMTPSQYRKIVTTAQA